MIAAKWIRGLPWFKQKALIGQVKCLLRKSGPEAVPSYDVHRTNMFHVQQQIALERKRKENGLPYIESIDYRIHDPDVLEEVGKVLHGGIDRALESVKAGELGPVQYQKWLQAIVVLHDVLLAYRAWEDEHHGFWYQGYVYDHLRLDETRHKAGFKTKLEWPLDLEACE